MAQFGGPFQQLWFVDIRYRFALTGRSAEAAWIRETLVHRDGVGALVGPTGMGMTTLAVAHAYEQRGRYPDGVALLRAGDESPPTGRDARRRGVSPWTSGGMLQHRSGGF